MHAFATWMHDTGLPFMRTFMGRQVDSVICSWTAPLPHDPARQHRRMPSAFDTPPTQGLKGPEVVLELHDVRVGFGLHRQRWHSAHATLAMHPVIAKVAPALTTGMRALGARLGHDDLDFTLVFDTYTGPVRSSITITCPRRRIYTNAQAFTTLNEMEAVASTPLPTTRVS